MSNTFINDIEQLCRIKNMEYIEKHTESNIVGIDTCNHFVEICKKKNIKKILLSDNSISEPYQKRPNHES